MEEAEEGERAGPRMDDREWKQSRCPRGNRTHHTEEMKRVQSQAQME